MARNITCKKCRHRHPAKVSCKTAKRLAAIANAKRVMTEKAPPTDWETLRELIAEYAEAYVADSWKGGGDPEGFAEIELNLKLTSERLNNHVKKMERERP